MTETSTVVDVLDDRGAPVRLGRQARCPASRCASPRTASCSLKGAEHLPRLLQERRRELRRRRSTAGCTPATSARIDEDGYVFITGRKKDIIITAGGKNLTPANIENDMKQTRWVSQAVMYGDRRPYPVMLVTLDEEQVVPWAREQGIEDTSVAALARDPKVRELIQAELDRANAKYAHGRAGQEVLHPRPRPLAGDRRADADAEGQAQRRQREVRRRVRRALPRRRLTHAA